MTKEQEGRFYSGFKTEVDQMPAVVFAQEFSKLFEKFAKQRFGQIIPNDRRLLFEVAEIVLIRMGKRTEQ